MNEMTKQLAKEKLQLAISNFKQAEAEGADQIAPETYIWAKHKIYEDQKIILKYVDDQSRIEEASDDACAAAAKLLSLVRRYKQNDNQSRWVAPEKFEQEAIKALVNEGGPAL